MSDLWGFFLAGAENMFYVLAVILGALLALFVVLCILWAIVVTGVWIYDTIADAQDRKKREAAGMGEE